MTRILRKKRPARRSVTRIRRAPARRKPMPRQLRIVHHIRRPRRRPTRVVHITHDLPLDTFPVTANRSDARIAENWVRAQIVNATRHLNQLAPFASDQYGSGIARPKEANVLAANALLKRERASQLAKVQTLKDLGRQALAEPTTPNLSRFAAQKDKVASGTRATEAIWHFYDDLFAQRTGPMADRLAAMDRIATDCYQSCYMGLGRARSLPTPPPMSFMEPASGPATYRRGVTVPKLARRKNPFPLVRLPFHRLNSPWSLGAVPHEIGHNVHADLDLWTTTPRLIKDRLASLDMPSSVQSVWARWHKEIYADLLGVLLIGPYYVESLMDVVGKSPDRVARFSASGVHPTSYLRPMISTALLRRIGFSDRARKYDQGWKSLYSPRVGTAIPYDMRRTFSAACRAVVDVLCFKQMNAYGGKALVEISRFRPQDMLTVKEAAERLAKGTNPGIAPERFFICAAREALDRRLASPEQITRNFYTTLTGR